ADAAVAADDGAGVNAAAGADDGVLADDGERVNGGVRADAGTGVDGGAGVNAERLRFHVALQVPDDGHEGHEGILDADQGRAGWPRAGRGHDARGAAAREPRGVLLVLQEGDVALGRLVEAARGVDDLLAVAEDLPLHQFGQLSHGNAHARTSFLP